MCVQAYKCKSIYLTETKPAFFWSGLKSELAVTSTLITFFFCCLEFWGCFSGHTILPSYVSTRRVCSHVLEVLEVFLPLGRKTTLGMKHQEGCCFLLLCFFLSNGIPVHDDVLTAMTMQTSVIILMDELVPQECLATSTAISTFHVSSG